LTRYLAAAPLAVDDNLRGYWAAGPDWLYAEST